MASVPTLLSVPHLTLAATHLPPWLAILFASLLILAMAWYWPRLGRADIHPQRRQIRRLSLLFSLTGLVAATLGFGVIDPDARPVHYSIAWLAASCAILVVVLLAMLDALLSLRLHQRAIRSAEREHRESLSRAIADAKSRAGQGVGDGDAP